MIPETLYLHYLSALLDGNKKQCQQIVIGLANENACMKEIYTKLFQRSMYRIGQMWENERCSVADEHIATKITESMIDIVSSRYSETNYSESHKTALVTCIDREFHELGARMVAGFLEVRGWNSIFIGSNTPQSDLIKLIEEHKPTLLGISNSFYINVVRLTKLIEAIKSKFPELEIIVGGQALAEGRSDMLKQFSNVHYIESLDKLDDYLLKFEKL